MRLLSSTVHNNPALITPVNTILHLYITIWRTLTNLKRKGFGKESGFTHAMNAERIFKNKPQNTYLHVKGIETLTHSAFGKYFKKHSGSVTGGGRLLLLFFGFCFFFNFVGLFVFCFCWVGEGGGVWVPYLVT